MAYESQGTILKYVVMYKLTLPEGDKGFSQRRGIGGDGYFYVY